MENALGDLSMIVTALYQGFTLLAFIKFAMAASLLFLGIVCDFGSTILDQFAYTTIVVST